MKDGQLCFVYNYVGLDRFELAPWLGDGAGTYRLAWQEGRPEGGQPAVDGHSLYVETLAELGLPGLALLLVAIAALLVAALRGLRGPDGGAHAALLGGAIALLLHAGIDWDWEMPAVTAWVFCAGGLALARPASGMARRAAPSRSAGPRIPPPL